GGYGGLLAFTKAGGEAAFTVVPDLAESLPQPTNGGKTWVFKLRKGIKFSNGQPVTVNDVVASLRRIFKVKSPTSGGFYSGIVGAKACLAKPAGCTLKGGVSADAKKNTVTINLVAPDPELKYKLAVPHATILPANSPTSDAGTKPLPGTGAYYFASYNPNKQLVMKRNPYFKQWSKAAQPAGYPDQITQSYGLTVEAQITAIENGQADWTLESPPADRLNEMGTKFASQTHVDTLTAFWYAPMHTRLAPFNNLKARQAVNYAIDRNATVKPISGSIFFTYAQNTKNKVQINVQQWYQDYPAASDFLHVLFGCESFHPGSDSSINIAGFCDKKINAEMHHALSTALENEKAANVEWAKIDRQVTDLAPMATLLTPKPIELLSKRLGNFVLSKP